MHEYKYRAKRSKAPSFLVLTEIVTLSKILYNENKTPSIFQPTNCIALGM